MADRFPPVQYADQNVPYDHPQYVGGSHSAARFESAIVDRTAPDWGPNTGPGGALDNGPGVAPGSGAGVMPTSAPRAGDADPVPVRDPYHFAQVFSQTTTPGNGVSSKFLDQPPTKRNLLMLRNASAAANIYIEFAKDATTNSVLRLTPNTMILFDTVVPQDDLYAIADAAGAVLAFGFSTIL